MPRPDAIGSWPKNKPYPKQPDEMHMTAEYPIVVACGDIGRRLARRSAVTIGFNGTGRLVT